MPMLTQSGYPVSQSSRPRNWADRLGSAFESLGGMAQGLGNWSDTEEYKKKINDYFASQNQPTTTPSPGVTDSSSTPVVSTESPSQLLTYQRKLDEFNNEVQSKYKLTNTNLKEPNYQESTTDVASPIPPTDMPGLGDLYKSAFQESQNQTPRYNLGVNTNMGSAFPQTPSIGSTLPPIPPAQPTQNVQPPQQTQPSMVVQPPMETQPSDGNQPSAFSQPQGQPAQGGTKIPPIIQFASELHDRIGVYPKKVQDMMHDQMRLAQILMTAPPSMQKNSEPILRLLETQQKYLEGQYGTDSKVLGSMIENQYRTDAMVNMAGGRNATGIAETGMKIGSAERIAVGKNATALKTAELKGANVPQKVKDDMDNTVNNLKVIDNLQKTYDQLENKFGPIAGRIQKLMQNKGFQTDPLVSKFMTMSDIQVPAFVRSVTGNPRVAATLMKQYQDILHRPDATKEQFHGIMDGLRQQARDKLATLRGSTGRDPWNVYANDTDTQDALARARFPRIESGNIGGGNSMLNYQPGGGK